MTARTFSPRTVLVAASAAQASVAYVTFGLPAIGPQLRQAYGLSLAELGAVLTASLLGAGLALILAGVLVDRVGSRVATFAGTSLATAGLMAGALVPSKGLLFLSLLVSGVGSAVVPVAGAGALLRVYPAARRGRALGIRQMAVPARRVDRSGVRAGTGLGRRRAPRPAHGRCAPRRDGDRLRARRRQRDRPGDELAARVPQHPRGARYAAAAARRVLLHRRPSGAAHATPCRRRGRRASRRSRPRPPTSP